MSSFGGLGRRLETSFMAVRSMYSRVQGWMFSCRSVATSFVVLAREVDCSRKVSLYSGRGWSLVIILVMMPRVPSEPIKSRVRS